MGKSRINPIEEVLDEFRKGNIVIMVDDQDRENEGDLLIAAEAATDRHINFMASRARGLICLALTEDRCSQLELPLMVSRNSARFSTNFTVSIEAARDVTTGISAQDRARTIQAAVTSDATPEDIVTPGHVFPIKAQPGGVLTRAGHTEAGVDMARLCGFEPASVICEILKDDGTMARLPDLTRYAAEHNLKIGTIADLIRYRLDHDPTLVRVSEQYLELEHGKFRGFVFRDEVEGGTHIALVKGELSGEQVVPVRVHVHRGALDVILNPRSPWSWTLENAIAAIAGEKSGVVVILSYNESTDELVKRIRTDAEPSARDIQADSGSEPEDLRMLGAGGQILADLGVRKILALGRSRKTHGLSGFGLEIVGYVETPRQLEKWKHEHQ
ncbi:MAG: 3,4-dihydroxy-2-butanone-4-phosphate synthase [Gammaproteobacteria bacterium]|nr:3,4-dihydroxy-2-butanone-4-phosphate synthase [Gammaproteobacteria bacterium]